MQMASFKYKIGNSNDSNLINVSTFKLLYPDTIAELNKCITEVILHAHNTLYIPQLNICRITAIHKGVEVQCSFFVVPRMVQDMHGHVYVYVCISYIYMYVHIHAHIHACVHTCACICNK